LHIDNRICHPSTPIVSTFVPSRRFLTTTRSPLRRENLTIFLGDSKELKVEDKGDVDITRGGPPVILHEVLIVPGSVRSLLSLGQATQRAATVEFKRDMRWIKHGDHVVIKAQQSGGLFKVASITKGDADWHRMVVCTRRAEFERKGSRSSPYLLGLRGCSDVLAA
jgi:hypothetical protein